MNQVILIARLVKDPETRYTASNMPVCSFTVAVDRRFKKDGEQTVDFIKCVAWNKTAEFVSKYFTKGKKIALTGSIQTRTWDDQEGKKHYATEINVNEVEFVESKKESSSDYKPVADPDTGKKSNADNFFTLDDNDEDVPF